MQLKQLQHFEALYRLRSFVQAADAHGVTQSALSRSLQKLEDELGQRLFDRTTHAVEPTDAAEGLIQRARDVIDGIRALEEEARQLRVGAAGHVRVGTGPYPAQPLLTSSIQSLSAKHHGIQVSVVAGTARDLLKALFGRELDFVVCDMSKYEDTPAAVELEVIELPREPLVVVLSAEHPVLAKEIDLAEAASYPWAMPTPAPIQARDLPRPFDEALAAGRFPFYRLETTAACLELVKAGRAITMVPRSLGKLVCESGQLVQRDVPARLRTNDGIHLIRQRTKSPSTRFLIDEIVEVAARLAEA
ncbi:MAG: LysR family transcriptional regulator [Myxococcales bacterium]|nr:LysR family transcriptional regulator [Myxococcales bacterium]HIK85791.1 LysR family transcriptional regulator [Myxococcales bacterium]